MSTYVFLAHAIIDGGFKSYVLCFAPLWESHSGSLLRQKYQEVVNAFGIANKVIRIVTDSAANNIDAFQHKIIPGFEHYFDQDGEDQSSDEDDNTNETNDDSLSDEYEYPFDSSSVTNNYTTSNDLTIQDLIQELINRLIENNEVFRIPCFAHTLQLVVRDGLKECTPILVALDKVSAIAKLAHTSTKFAEKLDSIKVSIPRAIITRWNSHFATVEKILTIPPIDLNEMLTQLKYKNLCLNTRDISMLREFIRLLSLFAEATVVTQQKILHRYHM